MEQYMIKNNPKGLGFLVEIEKKYASIDFSIYKITSVSEDKTVKDGYEVVEVTTGTILWDGSSDLGFGEEGYVSFGATEDVICFNKCLEFVWKQAEEELKDRKVIEDDSETIEKWIEHETSIQPFDSDYEVGRF